MVLLCQGYVVLKFDHTHEKQGTALYEGGIGIFGFAVLAIF